MFATACTHPLDTLKVRVQCHEKSLPLYKLLIRIVSKEGGLSLYSGLSAALLRQATYTSTRFAVYEEIKTRLSLHSDSALFIKFVSAVRLI